MGIIAWILLGLVAGLIARSIVGGAPGGLIVVTLVGVAGALVGGAIARALDLGDPIDEFFDLSTWLAAIVGSVILLAVFQAVAKRT